MKILILGKLGLKLVVLKSFASHTHAFYSYFSMLGGFYAKTELFFQNCAFLEFWSIKVVFRSIKIVLKILREPLSVSINWKLWIGFFKNWVWLVQTHFSKVFSNFSFSLRLGKGFFSIFCRFPLIFLQGFPLSKPVSPFYPSFCIYFHVFMHKFMHYFGVFDVLSQIFWNWSN